MENQRRQALLSECGKYMIDISKLVFGGVILAGIMKYESINPLLLFGLGGLSVLLCFAAGLILTALSKNK